jgi:hypothetical protein
VAGCGINALKHPPSRVTIFVTDASEEMSIEIKERAGNMEQTITQSGALYFVQHKGTAPSTPQRNGIVPRKIRSMRRRLSRIRLPRTLFYRSDGRAESLP